MRFLLFLFLVLTVRGQTARQVLAPLADATVYEVLPTGSMEPSINEHCWVLVKRLSWREVRVGSVIVYRVPEAKEGGYIYTMVCHRVWRISSGGTVALVKGDANEWLDPVYVTEANYVGTVVAVVRKP